jgi:hypothetical protein
MAAGAVTDSSGNFQGPHFLLHPGDSFSPSTHYGGDIEHAGAAAGLTIKITEKNSGRFTPSTSSMGGGPSSSGTSSMGGGGPSSSGTSSMDGGPSSSGGGSNSSG